MTSSNSDLPLGFIAGFALCTGQSHTPKAAHNPRLPPGGSCRFDLAKPKSRRLKESACTENSTESYGYASSFHHVTFHFVEVSVVPLPLGGRL